MKNEVNNKKDKYNKGIMKETWRPSFTVTTFIDITIQHNGLLFPFIPTSMHIQPSRLYCIPFIHSLICQLLGQGLNIQLWPVSVNSGNFIISYCISRLVSLLHTSVACHMGDSFCKLSILVLYLDIWIWFQSITILSFHSDQISV